MTHRIQHWERKYRVAAPAAGGRLDALAGAVLSAYEAAVRSVHGDSDEVVLVRAVGVRVALPPAAHTEAELVRQWGQAMAAAVLRAVADDDANAVARFPDRAAHLAAFVAAAADGRPVADWKFNRFEDLHRASISDMVAAALLTYPDLTPAALGWLYRSGALPRVVRALGPAAGRVWAETVAGAPAPSAASERPLFAAALSVAGRLGSLTPPEDVAEAWFADFLAKPRSPTDWRDRTHLAEGVATAVRFLLDRAPLTATPTAASIADAVAALDWLDTDWLRCRLKALTSAGGNPVLLTPRRPRPSPSPRQRQWLEAFHSALARLAPDIDRDDLCSPANAILVFAALTAGQPEWANDPALPPLIGHVLAAAAAGPLARETSSNTAVRSVQALGEPALVVVRALVERHQASVGPAPAVSVPVAIVRANSTRAGPEGVPTAAAGAYLLLRAANDLQLPLLARRVDYPAGPNGPGWLLAALAAHWVGLPLETALDPGLQALSGADPPFDLAAFRRAWTDEDGQRSHRFQLALARVLLGQRLLANPNRLSTAVVPRAGGLVAFAGDAAMQVWPFARPVATPDGLAPAVTAWQSDWEELTGVRPEAVVAEAAPLATAAEVLGGGSVGDRHADATLTAIAQAVVRAWARWLGKIGRGGTPYLLAHFVRRPGRIWRDGDVLLIDLDPRPLDVVLRMCGYLDPIELLPGSPVRIVKFRVAGAS